MKSEGINYLLGRKIYGRYQKKSKIFYLSLYLILYFPILLIIILNLNSERAIYKGFNFTLENILMLMFLIGLFSAIVFIYIIISTLMETTPAIYDNGLLLPPKRIKDAIRNKWKKYLYSSLIAIYPECTMNFFLGKPKNIVFKSYLLKFNDGFEYPIQSSLDSKFSTEFKKILGERWVSIIKNSKQYNDFSNIDISNIKKLFKITETYLPNSKKNILFNISIQVWICGGVIISILLPFLIDSFFHISENLIGILFMIFLLSFLIIPIIYVFYKRMKNVSKILILLHLIEFDEKNIIKKIPEMYGNKIQKLKNMMKAVPRTDLEITAKLME